MELMRAITIRKAPEEVYAFWRDFRNLPKFMLHLQEVQVLDSTHSHWATKAPIGGGTVEWDAAIMDDKPNELIAWESLPGASVPNRGHVKFAKAPRDQGTEVRVYMQIDVPGGKIGEAVAGVFGEDPKRQVYDDLRSLKQVLETGEVLFSDSSIHGKPHPAQPSDKIPAGAGIRTEPGAMLEGGISTAMPDAGMRPGMDIRRAPGSQQDAALSGTALTGDEIKGEVTE